MEQHFIAVAGFDSTELPSLTIHIVNASEAQIEMDAHKEMAIFEAEEAGYHGPFKTYDNNEHELILEAATVIIRMKEEGYLK